MGTDVNSTSIPGLFCEWDFTVFCSRTVDTHDALSVPSSLSLSIPISLSTFLQFCLLHASTCSLFQCSQTVSSRHTISIYTSLSIFLCSQVTVHCITTSPSLSRSVSLSFSLPPLSLLLSLTSSLPPPLSTPFILDAQPSSFSPANSLFPSFPPYVSLCFLSSLSRALFLPLLSVPLTPLWLLKFSPSLYPSLSIPLSPPYILQAARTLQHQRQFPRNITSLLQAAVCMPGVQLCFYRCYQRGAIWSER